MFQSKVVSFNLFVLCTSPYASLFFLKVDPPLIYLLLSKAHIEEYIFISPSVVFYMWFYLSDLPYDMM